MEWFIPEVQQAIADEHEDRRWLREIGIDPLAVPEPGDGPKRDVPPSWFTAMLLGASLAVFGLLGAGVMWMGRAAGWIV